MTTRLKPRESLKISLSKAKSVFTTVILSFSLGIGLVSSAKRLENIINPVIIERQYYPRCEPVDYSQDCYSYSGKRVIRNEKIRNYFVNLKPKHELDKHSRYKNNVRLVVNIPAGKLYLYYGDRIVSSYNVIVGSKRYQTPIMKTRALDIKMNPIWFPPKKEWAKRYHGDPIRPDDPRNPLGIAKIKLMDRPNVMIHGSKREYGISGNWSHGCIRMGNKDMEDLLNRLKEFHIKNNSIGRIEIETVYDLVDISYNKENRLLLINIWDNVYSRKSNINKEIKDKLKKIGINFEDLSNKSKMLFKKMMTDKRARRTDQFAFRYLGSNKQGKLEFEYIPLTVYIEKNNESDGNEYYIYVGDDQSDYISRQLYEIFRRLKIPKRMRWLIYNKLRTPGVYKIRIKNKNSIIISQMD